MMTTNQKGALAEAKITAAALALGIAVLRPLGDERYDLILDLRPRLLRVQCNWTVQRGAVVVVTCRTNRRGPDGFIRRTYESGEIDAIAAYCAANDECYLLPLELSVATPGVQLRLAPTLNNQRRRIRSARDYEFGATIERLTGPIAQLGERRRGTAEAGGSSPPGSTTEAA